jgi:Ca-activated chloride channel family protein
MAGEVTLRSSLARPQLPANTQQLVYVLVEIVPSEIVAHVQMPVSVAFVLDRSGSMEGDKILAVQQAMAMAIDMLNAGDSFAVVTFNHNTQVVVPHRRGDNTRGAKNEIARLQADGGTRMGTAIEAALKELNVRNALALHRIILLTDGATDGDAHRCVELAQQAGRSEIPITALGVGDEWNEELLVELAERSGGMADYIDRPAKLLETFRAGVQSAQSAVVQNSTLILRTVLGVDIRAVWQVIPLISQLAPRPLDGRSVAIGLGELEKGQGRTLVIELTVAPKPAGTFRIGQLDLQYDVPAARTYGEHARDDVLLSFTPDPHAAHQVDARIMNIVEKVSAHKLQTRALDDIAAGNVAGATQKLQSAVTRLLNQGEAELAQTLQQEVRNLQRQGTVSAEGKKTIKFGARKTVRLSDIDPSILPPTPGT